MKRTTRKKKTSAEIISTRSSQSDFSSAVTSCLDVPMRLLSVSWVDDVERRDAVDASVINEYQIKTLPVCTLGEYLASVMTGRSVQVLLASLQLFAAKLL
jgi:hypothetical protein